MSLSWWRSDLRTSLLCLIPKLGAPYSQPHQILAKKNSRNDFARPLSDHDLAHQRLWSSPWWIQKVKVLLPAGELHPYAHRSRKEIALKTALRPPHVHVALAYVSKQILSSNCRCIISLLCMWGGKGCFRFSLGQFLTVISVILHTVLTVPKADMSTLFHYYPAEGDRA